MPDESPGLFDEAPAPPPAAAPAASSEAPAEADAVPQGGPPVYTVTALTRAIGERLEELGRVRVEGEITDFRIYGGSGHHYFKLKEGNAVLDCKLWGSVADRVLDFEPEDGMQVLAYGRLDVYAPRGSYSLVVDRIEQRGLGELLARLEERKRELEARGWFARRRPLPELPRVIGVVTSRDSAAFQDFLRTRSLRWPLYPVRLAHAPVQGAAAAGALHQY